MMYYKITASLFIMALMLGFAAAGNQKMMRLITPIVCALGALTLVALIWEMP